jgi:hypothetical protein
MLTGRVFMASKPAREEGGPEKFGAAKSKVLQSFQANPSAFA